VLVLTRQPGESVVIGENITVTIICIEGDRIKLGITAPEEVSIYREELYLEIRRANEEAVTSLNTDLSEISKLFTKKDE
jgi:carbon storage regulator